MERYDELLQRRAALVSDQRRILDTAEGEDRSLTSEEDGEYRRMDADLDGLETRIARLKDQRERNRSLAQAETAERGLGRDVAPDSDEEKRAKAYLEAFDGYLRRGLQEMTPDEIRTLRAGYVKDETRAHSVGTDAKGGYTVPQDFYNRLQVVMVEANAMRQTRATKLETAGGNDIPIPKVTAHGVASWTGEAVAITESDETFAQVTLEAWKATRLVKVSLELLEDSGVDISAYLAGELGRSVGALEGAAFAAGDGSSKPRGIATAATVGVTAAAVAAVTADELIDTVYSVTRPYRVNGEFLVSDALVKGIRKLKDADNQYVWQPGLQGSEPDRLLGYPVITDADVADPTAAAVAAVFGDFSAYFIRDVRGFQVFRLNERYMDNGQVGFIGWHRTDGDLVDDSAVRSLKMAAS